MDFKKTLSYYERLGFDKIKLWSEEDLAQFLIWDYIETMDRDEYPEMQSLIAGRFLESSKRYRKYYFIKYLIDDIYNKFLRRFVKKNSGKLKILFNIYVSDKYLPIMLAPKKDYNIEMIAWGMRDRLFAVENFIIADNFPNVSRFVYNYFSQKNANCLYALIDEVKEAIKNINPSYIVLWGDGPPIERTIVAVAKSLGITTLEIQHGAYNSPLSLETGKVVDYVLVWGEYYKNLYIQQNARKPEDIYILGYPFRIKTENLAEKKNNRYKVYYLGQNFETTNKKFLSIKVETVKKIDEICRRLGMEFVYRPHPKDDRSLLKEKMPEIYFSSKTEKIEDSIAKGDIFISFKSTSLIEAAMRSKVSLQLMNYPLKSDNFEQLGICSKSFGNINELKNYLEKISKAQNLDEFKIKFNNDYIETRNNQGQRFSEILKEIENKRKP